MIIRYSHNRDIIKLIIRGNKVKRYKITGKEELLWTICLMGYLERLHLECAG